MGYKVTYQDALFRDVAGKRMKVGVYCVEKM